MMLVVLFFFYMIMIKWWLGDLIISAAYGLSDVLISVGWRGMSNSVYSLGFNFQWNDAYFLWLSIILAVLTFPLFNSAYTQKIDTEDLST